MVRSTGRPDARWAVTVVLVGGMEVELVILSYLTLGKGVQFAFGLAFFLTSGWDSGCVLFKGGSSGIPFGYSSLTK